MALVEQLRDDGRCSLLPYGTVINLPLSIYYARGGGGGGVGGGGESFKNRIPPERSESTREQRIALYKSGQQPPPRQHIRTHARSILFLLYYVKILNLI